jgi:hypothetical protein
MPKRKLPSVVRAIEGKSDRHKNFGKGDFRFALLEDNKKSYFAAWSFSDGYLVIPFDTQLEAVMFYQMVVEEIKKFEFYQSRIRGEQRLFNLQDLDKHASSIHSYLVLSWNWIESRIKNGERVVQSLQNTDSADRIFGAIVGKKIKDFIK